jgi:16S rRNA processing protein RimM
VARARRKDTERPGLPSSPKKQPDAKAPKKAVTDLPIAQPHQTDATGQDDLVSIAWITRPQGLKGEVVAEILTDFPDRFALLSKVYICSQTGAVREALLEDFWFHKDRIVLKFKNVDTRTEAEELRNRSVKIPSADLIPLPEDNYYEFQLEGCQVSTDTGEPVGRVKEIMRTGAAPVLVVEDENGAERLIPLAEEICTRIDVQAKKITITPPEGLLDL